MRAFIVYDDSGRIARSGFCQDQDFEAQAVYAGETVMEGEADGADHYILDGAIVERPDNPASVSQEGLTLTVIGAPAGSRISVGYVAIEGTSFTASAPTLAHVLVESFPEKDFDARIILTDRPA